MPDRKSQLSRASEWLLDRIARIRATEEEKRQYPISSPEFHRLAEEVTKQSRDVMRAAEDEEAIGNETEGQGDSIDDVAEEAERTHR